MIELSRALARRYRAVLRQALAGPRGDAPLVLCRAGPDGLTLDVRRDDVAVRFHEEGQRTADAIAFRASVLTEFEGRTDEPVSIEQVKFGKGRARWDDGVLRVFEFETVTPDSAPPFPDVPQRFTTQPVEVLQALDEAARSTARESGRFALTRLQLRGRTGEVIATDGRQLLVQGSFDFPWQEDLLVPRVLAFGSRELEVRDQPVGIGRTDSHIAVRVGPWLFLLAIDMHSRFPNTADVVPMPGSAKSRVRFDPGDAEFLAKLLPKLPGRGEEHDPLTLDVGQPPAVRARASGEGPGTEVVLARSTAFGGLIRLNTDRRYLYRALKLGFREIEVAGADRPLACRDGRRTFFWMPLEKSNTITPDPSLQRVSSAAVQPVDPRVSTKSSTERKVLPMPTPSSRQETRVDGNGESEPPDHGPALVDLIDDAEALRVALVDATGRATRLLAGLKHQKRNSRALEAAVATIRQLRLGS